MVIDVIKSIIPKASARESSPFEVSIVIVVVITLVRWSIFPPTIITAPTSETPFARPARTTVISEYLASII